MTNVTGLDRERIRQLYDLRRVGGHAGELNVYRDPYPTYHHLRQTGPVHEGALLDLMGWKRSSPDHERARGGSLPSSTSRPRIGFSGTRWRFHPWRRSSTPRRAEVLPAASSI